MKITLRKGMDYYGVEIDGKYGEVSLIEGKIIKKLLATIKTIIDECANAK